LKFPSSVEVGPQPMQANAQLAPQNFQNHFEIANRFVSCPFVQSFSSHPKISASGDPELKDQISSAV